ncbi:MAG: ribosome maturation factor RimP [candidate division NC10 bacterium]|nr:ribosome maturation factor RimP [candidate division NC10 bacterium]
MWPKDLVERLRSLFFPLVEGEGMELVDLEFRREAGGWVLRLYIDKPGGVTLADCQRISEQAGDLLDVEDPIDHPYNLEVSSPGLDRPLKTEADFRRHLGRKVRVNTLVPIQGQRRFVGFLRAFEDGQAAIEAKDGCSVLVPYAQIAKARLEVEV